MKFDIPERVIEKRSCEIAKKDGWYVRKFASPGKRSAPDRIFGKHGRIFFIEFKAPGKVPTPLQAEEHKIMRAAGLTVYVCDSEDAFRFVYNAEYEPLKWLD